MGCIPRDTNVVFQIRNSFLFSFHPKRNIITLLILCLPQSRPFWPVNSKRKQLYLKPTMSSVISKPVPFSCSHTTVLRMHEMQALSVEVHGEMEDSVTTIVIMPYSPGVGTVRIENLCKDIPIRVNQRCVLIFGLV